MNLHKSEEQAEALDLMRKKVNNELLCLKEKTKEELNLWSGLTTKFVMIKAFSDHLANTVELIEKQSQEAERSKSLLEGSMSEQLIFLSRATLEISDFSADLSYSEHERALCALHHGKLRDEMKDLEECLAQAVSEAADMAKYKEMIEAQLIAAKEISNHDDAMLLRIQESLLSNTEGAQYQCQSERLGPERSSTTIWKSSLQVADQLQAIRTSLQSQVEEHTSYVTYLEHCLASRREVTEDKLDVLQEVLQATQQKSAQASLEIQTLNQVIGSLKEQDDESAALVANLRQEVAEAKDTLKKNIEETAYQKAIEAIEVQNLNKVIRTLRDQNDESAALVANLRQEMAEANGTLNKQVEEMAQQKAVEAAENKNLNGMIRILKDQNDECTALMANLKQEVAELKNTLNKQAEESAQRMAVEAAEVHNLNEVIRVLKQRDVQSVALVQNAAVICASFKRELVEAKDALDKQVEESAQQMAAKTDEVQSLNEMINTLKEQNAESAALAQHAGETCASLKRELVEAKDALDKQVEESAQQMAAKTDEVQSLNEEINALKEQNAESAALAQHAGETCASLKRELVEVKDALDKQVEESAQQMAAKTDEVQSLNEEINALKEQNAESAALAQHAGEICASLKRELVEAKNALDKQVEESAQRMAAKTDEVQSLNEEINALKEQNAESAALAQNVARTFTKLKLELVEALGALDKHVEEATQEMAAKADEVQNLNEVTRVLKEQNAVNAELVASLRQEVAEGKDTLNKQIKRTAQQMALEVAEVQNLNELIKALKVQNNESAELMATLRQKVVDSEDTLNKQIEENAQRMAMEAVEVQNLNEVIRILKEQNDESTKLAQNTAETCATLKRELLEAKAALYKQTKELTYQIAVKTFEVQNLNEVINTLKEQSAESAELVATLKQEVAESKDALSKQIEETAQRMAMEAAEVQNLNDMIRALKEQNAESAELVQNAAECCAYLRQELVEAKDALDKQVEESAQRMAAKTDEVQSLNGLINTLKEQNAKSAELVASLRQEVAELKTALNKQIEETAHQNALGAVKVHNLNEVIRTLKEQNDETAALVMRLKLELAEAEGALSQEVQEAAYRRTVEATEIQNLNAVIRTLEEQNAESVAQIASLRLEVAEAQDSLKKKVHQTAQLKSVKVQNLNQEIKALKRQNAESVELVASLRQEVAEAKDAFNKLVEETTQRIAVESAEVHNLNEVIRTLKEQNDETAALVVRLKLEIAEAERALSQEVHEAACRKHVEATEIQNLNAVIRTLEEQNAESVELLASLRQELAEAKDTLNDQIKATVQWKTMEAVEVKRLNQVISILKEKDSESAELAASLRQEMTEAQESLRKQVQETIEGKAEDALVAQNLNETIKILKGKNDESAVLMAKLRQEVIEAKDALIKQVKEAAQRNALKDVEIQDLHELITVLKQQSAEISASLVNLKQDVAEANENINKESEETEAELRRSLVDDSSHTFKNLSDLMSWYTSDNSEERVQHESSVRIAESHPLRDLIISFRGQHLPELKRLGAHVKYAMVASVSAYTKLIQDSLQDKKNLEDEISNLRMKNYELCHQMVTAEKRLMDLKIQSECDLRAKEDVLKKHMKEASQRNDQQIGELRKLYELERKEFMSLESIKAEQNSQNIKGTRNAQSDCIAQNVGKLDISQRTQIHPPDDCAERNALIDLQSTRKEICMKASNEPQPKRLKSGQATSNADGDSTNVIVTKNKGKRSNNRAKPADTNNGRQKFNRRCKDTILVVEPEGSQSKGLSQTKRFTSSNIKLRRALSQSGAKDSSSPMVVDLTFLDSLVGNDEDQTDDPYAF